MKIYRITEWVKDEWERARDGWWGHDTWKWNKYDITHEFLDEEEFKKELYHIINTGGVISKVEVTEENEDYWNKFEQFNKRIKL